MKILFSIIGFLLLGLGIVGVILPGLPATPFLLIASYCFARSSRKLYTWIVGTSLYQKHLATYVKTKAMTKQTKTYILIFATVLLSIAFFTTANIFVRTVLIAVLCIKYYIFIFRIKTRT